MGETVDAEAEVAVESGTSSTTDGGERDDQRVLKPGDHDVLCGRGGGTNNHSGNVKFRQMVNEHKLKYLAASKVDKPKVARDVVKLWRALDPPGRFLARKDDSRKGPGSVKAEGNIWFDVGDKKAREKASQCLRERTPDVLPFVKEMQRQQDILTGQGMRLVEAQMRNMQDPAAAARGAAAGLNGSMNAMTMNPEAMAAFMNTMNSMNGGAGAMNNSMNGMNPNMNAMMAAALAANNAGGGMQGMGGVGGMSDSAVQNAFSTEYMFTHGFADPTPQQQLSMPSDPLSLSQMSADQQAWASTYAQMQQMQQSMQQQQQQQQEQDQQQHPGFVGSNSMPLAGNNADVLLSPEHPAMEPVPLPSGFPKAAAPIQPQVVTSSGVDGLYDLTEESTAGDDDELTLEEYQASMSGYKYSESSSNGKKKKKPKETERTQALQDMQSNSWVKSFHSVDTESKNDLDSLADVQPDAKATKSTKPKNKNSLEAVMGRQSKLVHAQHNSTRTMQTAASGKSNVSGFSAMSGISMMSEMTDFSSVGGGTQSSVISNHRDAMERMPSGHSLMSEVTDMSDALKSLDLSLTSAKQNI